MRSSVASARPAGRLLGLGAASVLAIACAGGAAAQTAGPTPPAEPAQTVAASSQADAVPPAEQSGSTADIVVTAQKRSQTLSDVPISITAQTGEQLLDRGITDVQGLVRVTPGLSYVESGNAVPVYSLRGVGFFDTSIGARPTVSVYLDEVPLPFSIMTTGASVDLERVEVIKGPQGTLFGQNATGGAINYIAARPIETYEAGVNLSYGRFDTVDVAGYVSGPIAPTLQARLSLRSLRSGDWQQSYTRDDSLGAKRLLQGRLQLDWTPDERLRFRFDANGFLDDSDTQAGQLVQVLPQTPARASGVPLLLPYPLSPERSRAADWNDGERLRRDNRFGQLSLRSEFDITDDLTLTSITAYAEMDVDQVIDQDGTALTVAESDVRGRLTSFSQEVRLAGSIGPAEFVVGANYARDTAVEANFLDVNYSTTARALPTGLLPSFNLTSDQKFDTKAVFGSVDLNLSETIVAHVGLRYTKADLDYAACTRAGDATSANTLTAFYNILRRGAGLTPITPIQVDGCVTLDPTLTPAQLVGQLNQDNISWRVGLDWKPAPQTLVYASVSRGYKAGSTPTPPALATAAFRPVTQESIIAYELGVKIPVIRRVLEATAAVFYYDYSDKQVLGRILTPPTQIGALSALVNIPTSRLQGAEFQLNAFPTPGLTLALAGTYLDSKVTGDFENFNLLAVRANFRGDRFPYTPKYQLVADGQYEAPVSDRLVGLVGANYNYRSGTTSGFGNVPSLDIDGYGLFDMRAGLRADDRRWQATLFMRNVANTYYWTNVARLTDTIRRYAGEPRTYGIQLSSRF